MAKKPEKKTPEKKTTGNGYDRKGRKAICAMADFIAAMGPLTSQADEARKAALAEAGKCGWKG